ncbi:MAG: glycosyltransferase family 4 protein [Acetomicrobium sp.]|nr:glycosyltransferase family 4 protein [Acetomicrobium sp.]
MAHYANGLASGLQPFCKAVVRTPFDYIKPHYASSHLVRAVTYKYNPLYYIALALVLSKKDRPDVVHVTSMSSGLLPFLATLRTLSISTVYTVHDPEPHEEDDTHWGRLMKLCHYKIEIPIIFRLSTKIHLHSRSFANRLLFQCLRMADRKIYFAQHGGFPPKDLNANRPKGASPLQRPLTFLFFGRIQPYKGLQILARAFQLIEQTRNLRLIVAGEGRLPGEILQMYQRSPNLHIINRFLSDDEIPNLMSQADVVILPYTSATQSGVIPLAYAFGLPVICTRVGALPEIVLDGQTGVLVQPSNAEDLADAMLRFLSNPSLAARMGSQAQDFLRTHLQWQSIAQIHYQQYLNILNQKAFAHVG